MDYKYCPKCDKLADASKGHCTGCKSRVVMFSAKTERVGILLIILLITSFLSLGVIYLIISEWWALPAGILVVIIEIGLIMLFALIYDDRMMRNIRELYKANENRYRTGETLDFRIRPKKEKEHTFSIGHTRALLWTLILCIALFILSIVVMAVLWAPTFCVSISFAFFVVTIGLLFNTYNMASRKRSVMDVFGLSLEDCTFDSRGTMEAKTPLHGTFSLHCDSGYEVAILVEKQLVKKGEANPVIWSRPPLAQRILGTEVTLPDYLSNARLREIKTLEYIGFEKRGSGTRIIARLRDKNFHSEAEDIRKTLEMLRDIERWA